MTEVRMEAVYAPSEDVVAREIEGELIIVPLVAGIGDMEDELRYVTMTDDGIQETLTPSEFAVKHGWKNVPRKAAFGREPTSEDDEAGRAPAVPNEE